MFLDIKYYFNESFNETIDFKKEITEYKISRTNLENLLRLVVIRLQIKNYTIQSIENTINIFIYDNTDKPLIKKEDFIWR
jgi:hypothetical protein